MLCKKPYRKKEKIGSVVTELGPEYGCGQCLHCRINHTRVWTHRILLESRCHDESSFVTLTYSDEDLPEDGKVNPKILQDFMKRLRYYAGKSVRFFGVGEYGGESLRPHYHLMLFGIGLVIKMCPDRKKEFFFSKGEVVERSWPYGFTYCGELNKTTARYITGYITKFIDKEHSKEYSEFMRCSLKPGLGANYMKKVSAEMCKWPHLEIPVTRRLVHGRKKEPLGRYLTHVLAVELDRIWDLEDEAVMKMHEEYEANKELEKRFTEKKVRMRQQEVKHNLYKLRRKL